MLSIYDELNSILKAFNENKIPYALCGGLAMAVYGYTRYTKDIDIIIRKRDLDRALKVLDPLNFILPAGIIPFKRGTDREQEIYRISKADGEKLLSLDLILVSPILLDVWKSRRRVKMGDLKISVVSREGLIFMKQIAGRDQDLLDVKKLKESSHENEDK